MSADIRDAGQRYLVATAVAHYSKNPAWNRPGLAEAREQVIDLFTGSLGYTHISDLGLDPTAGMLTEHLRALCKNRLRPNDYLVVYIAGHGEVLDDGGHVLLTSDSDPHDIEDSLPTVSLATKMLRGTPVQRLMLLLDTCYSGQGGNEVAAVALAGMRRDWTLSERSGFVVITSAQPLEQAAVGIFPQLLSEAIRGWPTAGQAPATLDIGAVVTAMNRNPKKPGFQQIGWTTLGLTGQPPEFLPNPRHHQGMADIDLHMQRVAEWETHAERREVEFRRRFLIKAMGGHGDHPAWWFSGRHTAMAEIAAWLSETTSPVRALVVTAGPGSGKTAVLGLASALSHSDHRRIVPIDALALPSNAIPPVGSIDVTIYAGGLTHEQVLSGLAAAAHLPADVATIGELIIGLQALRKAGRPFTAIIDAIDEAADPSKIIAHIVRPIVSDTSSIVRLLVGMRPHLLNSMTFTSMLADMQPPLRTIDLDSSQYADMTALTAYTVRGLLEARTDTPYLHAPPSQVRAVAEAVAAAAAPSFLVARIASTTLAGAASVADPTDPAWRAGLPTLPGEALRSDLDTRLGEQAQKARDLLRPLAYAEGQGLPWEDIWAPLASRIAGRTYTDADLFWLREHAGSYVVEATEFGRSAYRLYHQALAEHLRDDSRAAGITAATIHQAFVDTLMTIPRHLDTTRDWSRAHPYALHHLATHARQANTLNDLVLDVGFLAQADGSTLLAAIHHVTTDDARTICTVYRATAHLHRHLPPASRRQILALDAARGGADAIRRVLNEGLAWQALKATGGLLTPALHATLATNLDEGVSAVACCEVDGAPVAITGIAGFAHGEIRLWDLRTGACTATLTGHLRPITTLASMHVDGTPVVVVGAGDRAKGELIVWDLRSGTQRATLAGHRRVVNAVACTELDGIPVAVTGGGRRSVGEVLVWDLRVGALHAKLTGHSKVVNALACTKVDGVPIVVAGGGYGRGGSELIAWDLRTGTHRTMMTKHNMIVKAIACIDVDGAPLAVIASASRSGDAVWTLDLRTGTRRKTLSEHGKEANAVACLHVDGIPLAIASGIGRRGGELRAWNLRTGDRYATLPGHAGAVNAVACIEVDGVQVAVGGGGDRRRHDGEIRVWQIRSGISQQAATSPTVMFSALACVEIDGAPMVVSGGVNSRRSGEVHLWELQTGIRRHALMRHTTPVRAVACTNVDGTPTAITVGGSRNGGELFLWDLNTGADRIPQFRPARPINAVACTTIDGVPVAVSGGGRLAGGEVLVWDLRTGACRGPLTGATKPVNAVACMEIDGAPIAVTGGGDFATGEVLVWDLRTGACRNLLTEATKPVRVVACATIDGIPVAIVSGSDPAGGLLVWDLLTSSLRATLSCKRAFCA